MKVDYDQGKDICLTHVCGVEGCGGELVLRWLGGGHVVCCPKHPAADSFKSIESVTTELSRSPDPPAALRDVQEAKAVRKAQTAGMTVHYEGYTLSDVRDAGTDEPATHDQVVGLIAHAVRYGLDPYRQHVCLMYGRPHVEVDGLYYLAQKTGDFNGMASSPVGQKEKEEWGLAPEDIAWRVIVYRKGIEWGVTATQIVRRSMLEERSKSGKSWRWPTYRQWPDRMCEKGAERLAFRKAFPDWTLWGGEQEEVSDGETA